MERPLNVIIVVSGKHLIQHGDTIEAKSNNAKKLRDVNLNPVFLSDTMDEKTQDKLYQSAYGVLIPGGGDVDPSLYGENVHAKAKNINPTLDKLQLRIIKKTLEDKKPLLGICRGAQVLAVACGGKIIQHLPDVTEEEHGVSVEQHDNIYPSSVFHDVYIKPQTKASKVFNAPRLNVPSRHHQAIKDPGELIISGISPSGIAEIVEHPKLPFHIGIQTHPELVNTLNTIFEAFAKAVAEYHHNSTETGYQQPLAA